MKYETPEDYVRACEEAYSFCGHLPHPETLEQFLALDKSHPATRDRMGWADCVEAPVDWRLLRPPEPDRFESHPSNQGRK